ncbi:hypothetical protein Pmani_033954 [Petrolisthes manimaculis]|uniref:GTP-binding protein 10 n=1 Tax=Petrolisthes manimaculis TaxID=1843537 RepID=A0AAE1NPK6_9EUCA|nr:hypothetical protein Pmani_033954 [Petrolisthes manimaculis]
MGLPRYGGIAGKGGDVYVEAVKEHTLYKTMAANSRKRWSGGIGGNSRRFCIMGEAGKDLTIPIPKGITVKLEGIKSIGEINNDGEKIMVARGGAGGSPLNQYNGQKGQAHNIVLELKLLADIGLVGFPNAGKSTLLRAISKAKPKVASYPFTTLRPTLGTLEYPDMRQMTMADLPGLIEGAWANTGMGHKFLRHVERTKLLLFVVDVNGFCLGPQYPYRSATETIILLNKELEIYKWDLVDKPAVLMVNKMDTPGAEEKLHTLVQDLSRLPEVSQKFPEEYRPERWVNFSDVVPCSAKENPASIEHLKQRLRHLLDFHHADIDSDRELVEAQARGVVQKLLVHHSKKLV